MAAPRSWAHKRLVFNLVKRGRTACEVCVKDIDVDDSTNVRVVLLDFTQPRHVRNMGLRHKECERSKYRPALNPFDLVKIVETMIASPFKICAVCRRSWVDVDDPEDLMLVENGDVVDVAHKKCPSVE